MKKLLFIIVSFLFTINIIAQNCEISKYQGMGYTTVIESVIDNCDDYTIVAKIIHNGCSGPQCKELSHFSIEAIPGTYSDISVDFISGNMTYSNIDYGPNLGNNYPFDGFKIDGISGIGDGQSGIFTITYTLDYLQNQIFLAKAGPGSVTSLFTVNDFEYVRDCNGTICDTNNIVNHYPANGFGTLAFEDLYPGKGDYDFNDLVLDYQFDIILNNLNNIIQVDGTFIIKAFGASFENGFGFQLSENINQNDIEVSGYELTENIISLNSDGLENNQDKPTIIVYDNAFNQMQSVGGIGVNTDPNINYVTPDTINITIIFNNNYTLNDLNIAKFNPFIFVDLDRTHEVHLPDYPPTNLMNTNLFGMYADDSDPINGRYFKTQNNLPWAINIYESFNYPIEKVDIINAHLKFKEWAESGGILYQDWYLDKFGYRNSSYIY